MEEEPETDTGYVTLVNAKYENGKLVECDERTGIWAWRHPHLDGSVTYTLLEGRVVFENVDFGYIPGKKVLKKYRFMPSLVKRLLLLEQLVQEKQQ